MDTDTNKDIDPAMYMDTTFMEEDIYPSIYTDSIYSNSHIESNMKTENNETEKCVTITYTYDCCQQCEECECKGCSRKRCVFGNNCNAPQYQYQTQKIIQHTVRMYASLYAMNLASLSAYKKPLDKYQVVEQAGSSYYTPPGVCWNQMSDRPVPSNQQAYVPTSFNSSLNNRHHSVTSSRPGCQSPGGIGVDIKHNSYDRYLNRIKGKKPLRVGVIPPTYGLPLAFNRAYPIYGGKIVKTGVIDSCLCIPDNRII